MAGGDPDAEVGRRAGGPDGSAPEADSDSDVPAGRQEADSTGSGQGGADSVGVPGEVGHVAGSGHRGAEPVGVLGGTAVGRLPGPDRERTTRRSPNPVRFVASTKAATEPPTASITTPPPTSRLVALKDLAQETAATTAAAWHGPSGRHLRLATRAGAHAALAAIAGWLAAVAVCLTVWLVSAPDTSGFTGPLHVAAQLWLVAHHAGLAIPAGRFGLAPLGFTVLVVVALLLAAVGPIASLTQLAYVSLGTATGYILAAALICAGAATSDVHPDVAQALLAAFCFGVAVPILGHWGLVVRRLPAWVQDASRAAIAASAVLLAGAAGLLAVSLAAHLPGRYWPQGFGDACGMFLLVLAVLPNALVWAIAYLLGPGFAVGTSTSVAYLDVHTGRMPAFPLLQAVPGGQTPYALALLAIPVGAGVALGILVARADWPLREAVRATATAVAAVSLALGLLATLSGGPIAGGRMATLGPSGWQTAAATAIVLGVTAAAVVLLPSARRASERGLLSVRRGVGAGWTERRLAVGHLRVAVRERLRRTEVGGGLAVPEQDDDDQPEQGRDAVHDLVGDAEGGEELDEDGQDTDPEEDGGQDPAPVAADAADEGHPEPHATAEQRDHDRDGD